MPKSNKIALPKAKRGRPKDIPTPELMWQYFEQYRAKVKSNPILVQDFVGKDADEVRREKERPLTFVGFQNYLDEIGVLSIVDQYFENRDGRYSDFVAICTRIKRSIQEDQITGGMAGIYNPSITQRLNGLVEKTEVEQKGNTTTTVVNIGYKPK